LSRTKELREILYRPEFGQPVRTELGAVACNAAELCRGSSRWVGCLPVAAVTFILPQNVGAYFAPQDRFLPECSTLLCVLGFSRQTHALFGFVIVPIQD
jgi:hypothetical protein